MAHQFWLGLLSVTVMQKMIYKVMAEKLILNKSDESNISTFLF